MKTTYNFKNSKKTYIAEYINSIDDIALHRLYHECIARSQNN